MFAIEVKIWYNNTVSTKLRFLSFLKGMYSMVFSKALGKLRSFIKQTLPRFLSENLEMKTSNKYRIIGCAVGSITLLAVIFLVGQFTSQEFASKWVLLAFALICPFVLAFVTAYNFKIKNERINKIWHLAFIFLMPFITITMTEALNDIFIYNMTYLGFFANYIVILIFLFLVFAITGSFRVSYLFVNTLVFGLGIAHSYLMDFRGTPFLPMDFLSVTTAVGVANTYNYTPTYKVILASLIYIFVVIVSIKIKTPKYNFLTKIISRTFAGTFAAVILLLFYGTSFFADMGVRPDFWNQNRGYRNYGFVFSFFSNTKYLYMSEPADYNPNDVDDYVNNVKDNEDENEIDTSYKKPNIICIMNESLSDLRVLGEFETNKDYMPFMRSLKKNTIKGNLYVPVIGAGTSNTEFEFLTGHTTAFLPSGSNAYMLYVDKPIASLVSTVKAQGYSSYAMHPYYSSGWKRTEVYNNFGFDIFTSLEDLMDINLMAEYQKGGSDADYLQQLVEQMYPDKKNMLIRQYVSDEYNYQVLIDDFENRDKSVPYFAFNVTMQNHGGYTTSASNFDESVYSTSVSQKYIKADKYLSLIKASDDAFKGLIEYFSKVDEPTLICMFGDHQPSVENEFIAELLGVSNLSNLTPEQEQSRHCTPFYIWANYDIEEKNIERLSSNYLSSLVLETAGIKLTEYNKYLLNLAKTLPVIDTVGYVDSEGNHYKWSDTSPYTHLLDDYEKVQYNNIFDQQNVKSEIFYINGYTHKATNDETAEE